MWRGVLEGVTCDQDFLRLMFDLTRTASHQHICCYCNSIQWVSTRAPIGPNNDVESLYTIFGPREGDVQTFVYVTIFVFRMHF